MNNKYVSEVSPNKWQVTDTKDQKSDHFFTSLQEAVIFAQENNAAKIIWKNKDAKWETMILPLSKLKSQDVEELTKKMQEKSEKENKKKEHKNKVVEVEKVFEITTELNNDKDNQNKKSDSFFWIRNKYFLPSLGIGLLILVITLIFVIAKFLI